MKNYFTPVEFAKLFGIDKQTLIYYDNRGIFRPDTRMKRAIASTVAIRFSIFPRLSP